MEPETEAVEVCVEDAIPNFQSSDDFADGQGETQEHAAVPTGRQLEGGSQLALLRKKISKTTRDPSSKEGWGKVEIAVLAVAIAVVWSLLVLPVVFYYIPGEEVETMSECTPYSTSESADQICQDSIRSVRNICLSGTSVTNTTDVYIFPRSRTQQELEDILLLGLELVGPSPECEKVIVPFLCLYYLRLCDGEGEVTYHPSVDDCVEVSTEICSREWAQANELLILTLGESLPLCEALENDTSLECDVVVTSTSGDFFSDTTETFYGNVSMTTDDTVAESSSRSKFDNFCAMYTGSACRDELLRLQTCLPGRNGSELVYIPSDVDQTVVEGQVTLVKGGLANPLLNPSTECLDAVEPFLCLYYFGLCDASGNTFEPSAETCVSISTDVCQREWGIAAAYLTLPTCDSFPEQQITCNGTGLASTDGEGNETVSASGGCPRECSDDFYCTSEGLCWPRCDKWQQRSRAEVIATDVVTIFSAVTGIFGAAGVIGSSCKRRRKVFIFPSVIIVYQTIALLVIAVTTLIIFTDRGDLFCNTQDLWDSLNHPTPFCTYTGVVFTYVLLQLAVWWLSHVLMLSWKVLFPLHSRNSKTSHRLTYLHIICVISALLLPAIPVIAAATKGGFVNYNFPPFFCIGRDIDVLFYSVLLPITIVLQIGIPLLIIVFWRLHKQGGLIPSNSSKTKTRLSTPEKKILIVLCYYILLGVVALSAFTSTVKENNAIIREYQKYFLCESKGIDPDDPQECDRSGFEKQQVPGLLACVFFLIGMFPAVNLTFAVNFKEVKQFFKSFKGKLVTSLPSTTQSTSNTSQL